MILPRFLIVGVLAMLSLLLQTTRLTGQVATSDPQSNSETQTGEAASEPASTESAAGEKQTITEAATTVGLVIDFGNGFEMHYTHLAWADDLTVLAAMQAAAQHAHKLQFTHRGKGETAYLTAIGGQENEGGSGSNWIFYVNGERADRSFGVKALAAGDTVLWSFE